MDEKELKRLKELKSISAETLSDGDKAELSRLEEKQEVQANIKTAMESFFRDSPFLKAKNEIDTKKIKEEELVSNPGYALSKRLVGIKRNNPDMIKAADPIVVSANDDAGGYLVPAVTEARILELMPTYGQARQYMTTMPIGGGVLHIPKEGTLPTWTYGISENASITSSKPTFGTYDITPSKGGALVVISNEMLRDANVNIGDYIIRKIAQAKGTGDDSQFFNGTGSPFTGVFRATASTFGNLVRCTTGATITYANLLSTVYGIDQNYLNGASWFMHRTVLASVMGILDGQQRPIFQPAFGGTPATLLGYPVVVVENAPTASVSDAAPLAILGNLDGSIIGDVMGMEVKILTEATIDATNLAQYDLTGIRVIARCGFTSGQVNRYSLLAQQDS
jgi:HK97 family phage major capsid protein